MIDIRVTSKKHASPDGAQREILSDVAFKVGGDETVALLGRSGIGKTSLLHLIAGLDREFDGHIGGAPHPVGFVFQTPRLLPWRSALQNLQIIAPERDTRDLTALLETVGVGEAADQFPGQLSLGMARRVAVARALAVQPSLLLLDEPFASLDIQTADRLKSMLKRVLAETGIPTLIVTHDPAEALDLADRVIVLGGAPATVQMDVATRDVTPDQIAASIAS